MTRKQRIKTVRDMARRIRYTCDTQSIYRFRDIEDTIRKQERQHRKGYGSGGYRESVAVAVDYFIVRCFADAFRVVRDTETARDVLDNLAVRLDYLMAISVVAQYEAEITSAVHVGDLMEAADILDYSDDIARR
mgnify:FL=1